MSRCACWQEDDQPSAAHSPLCPLHNGCDWARRVVASIPRPTPAEQDAAALDYAETRLSEIHGQLLDLADQWDRDARLFDDGVAHFVRSAARQVRDIARGELR